jgi:hypothetical protein
MALDIYSRAGQDYGGTIAADATRLIFSSGDILSNGGVGLLTQNVAIQYSQAISRIYEIGTQKTFYVVGRAQGNMSMARILGPRQVQLGFYRKFGNACNAAENNVELTAEASCLAVDGTPLTTQGSYSFGIRHLVIVSMGITVGAMDMLVNEQLSMMFIALNAVGG